jgi:HSP20 family protein
MFILKNPITSKFSNTYYSPLFKNLDELVNSALDMTTESFSHKLTLSEDDANYYLHLDVPGYKNSEIDINVEGSNLSIKARNEKRGVFSRTISLWSGLNTDKITGRIEDGILVISLPKVEKVKSKKIKVE